MKHLLIIIATLALSASSQAAVITLIAGESYTLGSNDVAEVVSTISATQPSAGTGTVDANASSPFMFVDGKPFPTAAKYFTGYASQVPAQQPVIAGPRTIAAYYFITSGITNYSIVTMRVTDKTTYEQSRTGIGSPALTGVVPNEPGNFNVVLEASSDLLRWSAALPGTFSGSSTNRFFRVRIERAP
jgi:hypothetical protein